jgi:hypothetical protein
MSAASASMVAVLVALLGCASRPKATAQPVGVMSPAANKTPLADRARIDALPCPERCVEVERYCRAEAREAYEARRARAAKNKETTTAAVALPPPSGTRAVVVAGSTTTSPEIYLAEDDRALEQDNADCVLRSRRCEAQCASAP